jgi:hypothetical protein
VVASLVRGEEVLMLPEQLAISLVVTHSQRYSLDAPGKAVLGDDSK